MENKETYKIAGGEGHDLILKDRNRMTITGVKEVLTFNEDNVVLQTSKGDLHIKGEKLNVKKLNLDDGNLEINGFVTHIEYVAEGKKKGFLKNLFK